VRWFFTSRPFIPWPHSFYSIAWDQDNPVDWSYDTGEPGEIWTATRPYRKGQAPDLTGCNEPFGSPAAWQGLADETFPLTVCGGAFPAAYADDFSDDYDSLTFARE
jgi:hypothetical protein